MDPERESLSKTRKATIVASAVALCLVVIKISVGIGSGAMVLIASAVDSGLDFMVSMFNFLAVRTSEKPSDHKFNYGRGKVEGLASFVEGLVIAISSLVIVITAIYKIVHAKTLIQTTPAVVVMIISTLLTACLVIYLRKVAKKTGSLVIKADSLHYQMDLYTNLGILVALAIISQTGWHLVDPIISIGIAIYMIVTSWELVRDGMDMLLDHALPAEMTAQIEEMIPTVSDKINSFHELKTRHSASVNFVDVHLVFQRDISLMEAHRISDRVEQKITDLQDCTWVINCHMDPIDDSHKDKAKGP